MVRETRNSTILLSICFISLIAIPAHASNGTTNHKPTIQSFSYSGGGAVEARTKTQYVWQSAHHTFDIRLNGADTTQNVQICLHTKNVQSGGAQDKKCERKHMVADSRQTVTISLDRYLQNTIGSRTVYATIRSESGPNRSIIAQKSETVFVLRKHGDFDGDGLANRKEIVIFHTNPSKSDTDEDGLTDGQEVHVYHTDPNKPDTDGDGLNDSVEVKIYHTNPNKPDTDGDGLPDGKEMNIYHTNPNKKDTDGDGLSDGKEVNTYHTNPLKADTDGDGLPDGKEIQVYHTDPNNADTDGDALSDGKEVHVYHTNPNIKDTDGDGLNDSAEVTTYHTDPNKKDTDDDGLSDGKEVHVYGTNPNKKDTDGDGIVDGAEVLRGTNPTSPNRATVGERLLGTAVVTEVTIKQLPMTSVGYPRIIFTIAVIFIAILALIKRRTRIVSQVWARTLSIISLNITDSRELETEKPSSIANREELTNTQRVLHLLDEHDGRIKQSELVTEYSWSKATVSRTLSAMEENGDIVKIDIGQTNLVTRPEGEQGPTQSSTTD